MIRAVLDTNIIISALLFGGSASTLVPGWQHRRFALLASKPLVMEYIRVLHYAKFHLTSDEVRYVLEEELLPFIAPVKATRPPRVIHADPSDNQVLACAVAGKAEIIVSGDHHLLEVERYRRIPILPLSAFLQQLHLL